MILKTMDVLSAFFFPLPPAIVYVENSAGMKNFKVSAASDLRKGFEYLIS